ncbi:Lrp/AsnC family transcriptional regulator [Gulosibacter sp. 10]|uniref:Lrp/AsnC family transcriptional regulator n=1 Tax=Gulosibacter sp. 10 TaxID=1255570 RepID=UPI00097F1E51|nr:Lrp/AsnC ligand binding domain-containing protein [Gulosibacter sp. 10]SJM61683.1 Transcriptional regulator, AsnC family [Gulosibacter sp. 10]
MPDSQARLDEALVAALRDEPRATVLALARRTGFPRAVIAARLRQLQESGDLHVVAARHPAYDDRPVIAAIAITADSPIDPLLERLRAVEEAVLVSAVIGAFDITMEVRLRTHDELARLTARIRAIPGVASLSTLLYARVLKSYVHHLPVQRIELDERDGRLIRALGRDGRMSWQELAVEAGLSPSAARTRVHRILDAGAARIVVMERGGRFGRVLGVTAGLNLAEEADAALQGIREAPEVEFVVSTIGRFDAIVHLKARGAEGAHACLERIRAHPRIARAETWTHLVPVKEQFSEIL